jgi:hypothetical protein
MGLKGYRLWDMGQLESTCRAPPRESLLYLSTAASSDSTASVTNVR